MQTRSARGRNHGVPGVDRNGIYGYQLTNDLYMAEVRRPGRRWITAGLTLGGGTPLVMAVGLGFTLAISLLIGRFLPEPLFFLLWFTGVAVSAVPLWYLVAGCVRAGGWRALFVGVGLVVAVAVASYGLGSVTRAAQPEPYRMAGAAWIIFGYVLGLAGVPVLVMGGVALRLQARRRDVRDTGKQGPEDAST